MQKNKILSMLGLARRARKLTMGHDMAMKSLVEKKASLLLFASDTSERLQREFNVTIEKNNIKTPTYVIDATIDEIHFSCGYKAGVMTVDDENFSKKIISLIND